MVLGFLVADHSCGWPSAVETPRLSAYLNRLTCPSYWLYLTATTRWPHLEGSLALRTTPFYFIINRGNDGFFFALKFFTTLGILLLLLWGLKGCACAQRKTRNRRT
ncbi:hypothetical protein M413DRAFT_292714 [Hebeloma cylindrosporum]|uniref:Uncharacterized protein n=1 Tax=Hebeloma cylindrosporum TaxID=76867 RepID=A0A0C3CAB8_HEBCY|nr:hypothetical protein M413DRAFT_292714 [Hebeloma cylindrosporum h7]